MEKKITRREGLNLIGKVIIGNGLLFGGGLLHASLNSSEQANQTPSNANDCDSTKNECEVTENKLGFDDLTLLGSAAGAVILFNARKEIQSLANSTSEQPTNSSGE